MKFTRSSYVFLVLLVLALISIFVLAKNQHDYKSALNQVMYKDYMTLVSTLNNTSLALDGVSNLNDISYEKAKILVAGYEIINHTLIQMNDITESLNLVSDNSLLNNLHRNVDFLVLFSDYITYGASNVTIGDKEFQDMVKYNNDLNDIVRSYNTSDQSFNFDDWIRLLEEVSSL